MRYTNRFHHTNRFAGGRSRVIKSVPKAQLLAAIAQSKQAAHNQPAILGKTAATVTFAEYALNPVLCENIRVKGFSALTPIQIEVIPAVLDNRDVIGVSNTGTGKTAAFLIPLVQKVTQDRLQRVLVVAPTRELAYQIHNELRDFARGYAG
jgi:superfamily II DNA/RNA helicase